jgi:hypothetical protein
MSRTGARLCPARKLNLSLKVGSRSRRVLRVANRAADNEKAGTGANGFLWGTHSLLVIVTRSRTNPGCDQVSLGSQCRSQPLCISGRADKTPYANGPSQLSETFDVLGCVTCDAELREITRVE